MNAVISIRGAPLADLQPKNHPAPPCLGEALRRGILNYSIIHGNNAA